MTAFPDSFQTVQRCVAAVRRRSLWNLWAATVPIGLAGAGVLTALVWAITPTFWPDAPANFHSGSAAILWPLGALLGLAWGYRRRPDWTTAALELDRRFGLQERCTTALGLTPADRESPAGRAVLADAQAHASQLRLAEQFPLQPRKSWACLPASLGLMALAFWFPWPVAQQLLAGTSPTDTPTDTTKATETDNSQKLIPFTQRNKPPELANRTDKSQELKDLEASINELMRQYDTDPKREDPEKLREKIAEMTALEQKVQQFNQEKRDRLEKLEKQLESLDRLNQDKDFEDGPAKKLNDALQKGDLEKAKEELDQLKKKVKQQELNPQEQEQLKRQVEKMREQLQRQDQNQKRQDKLKEMIEQAKKEGRQQDAESLERELKQLQQECQECKEASQKLSEALKQAKEALDKGDMEEAAKALESAQKQLEQTESDLKDLEESEQNLQRLKDEKKSACKKCNGESDSSENEKDDAEWTEKGAIGKGRRKENKDAQTAAEEQRVRGLFDPRGKKTYGGSTKGQAFKSASTGELGPAIQSAAQEAPAAADSQRLPREAKQSVKEYFEKLGEQPEGGKN